MFQVIWLDTGDPLSVIRNLGPRLDECIKHNIAVEVDDANSGKSVTLFSEYPFAIKG
jgi:hypothetical protein